MKKLLTLGISLLTLFGSTALANNLINNNKNLSTVELCAAEGEVQNQTISFKDLQTLSKLKFTYNSDTETVVEGNNFFIKFGVKIPKSQNIFNENNEYGMIVVPTSEVKSLFPDDSINTGVLNQGSFNNIPNGFKLAFDNPGSNTEKEIAIQKDKDGNEYYQYAWVLDLNDLERNDFFSFSAVAYEKPTEGDIKLTKPTEYSISKLIDRYCSMTLFDDNNPETNEDVLLDQKVKRVLDKYSGDNRRNIYLNQDIFIDNASKFQYNSGNILKDYDFNNEHNFIYVWGNGAPTGQWLKINDINDVRVSSGTEGAIFAQFENDEIPYQDDSFNKTLYRSKKLDANYLFYDNMYTYTVNLNTINNYIAASKNFDKNALEKYDLYALGINDTNQFYKREKVSSDGKFKMSDRINEVLFAYVNKDSTNLPFTVHPYIKHNADQGYNIEEDSIIKDSSVWNYTDIVAVTQNFSISGGSFNFDNYMTIDNVEQYMATKPTEGQFVYAWLFGSNNNRRDKFVRVTDNKVLIENNYQKISFVILNEEQADMNWGFVDNKHKIYQSVDYTVSYDENGLKLSQKIKIDFSDYKDWVFNSDAKFVGTVTLDNSESIIVNGNREKGTNNIIFEFDSVYKFSKIEISRNSSSGENWNTFSYANNELTKIK